MIFAGETALCKSKSGFPRTPFRESCILFYAVSSGHSIIYAKQSKNKIFICKTLRITVGTDMIRP